MTTRYTKWTHRPLDVGDGSHIPGCHIVENGGSWVASQVVPEHAALIASAPELLVKFTEAQEGWGLAEDQCEDLIHKVTNLEAINAELLGVLRDGVNSIQPCDDVVRLWLIKVHAAIAKATDQ